MKLGFQYGTRYIDFNVVFRDRKTMTIEVEPSGDVNVIVFSKKQLKKLY